MDGADTRGSLSLSPWEGNGENAQRLATFVLAAMGNLEFRIMCKDDKFNSPTSPRVDEEPRSQVQHLIASHRNKWLHSDLLLHALRKSQCLSSDLAVLLPFLLCNTQANADKHNLRQLSFINLLSCIMLDSKSGLIAAMTRFGALHPKRDTLLPSMSLELIVDAASGVSTGMYSDVAFLFVAAVCNAPYCFVELMRLYDVTLLSHRSKILLMQSLFLNVCPVMIVTLVRRVIECAASDDLPEFLFAFACTNPQSEEQKICMINNLDSVMIVIDTQLGMKVRELGWGETSVLSSYQRCSYFRSGPE